MTATVDRPPSSFAAVTSSSVTGRTCAAQVLGDDEDAHASLSCTISCDALRDLGRAAVEHLGAFALRGDEHPADTGGRLAELARLPHVDLLLLRLLDRPQRRVARLVDPGLDREHGRRVDLDDVDEPALELAVDRRRAVAELELRRRPRPDGRSRSSASAAPVAACTESLDCTPQRTRSGLSPATTSASARATVDRVEPARPPRRGRRGRRPWRGSAAWRPRASSSPTVTTTTSPSPAASTQPERLLGRVRVPLVEREVEVVGIDVPLVVGELDLVAERRATCLTQTTLHLQTARPAPPLARSPWRSRLNGSGIVGFVASRSRGRAGGPSKTASAISRGATQSPIR